MNRTLLVAVSAMVAGASWVSFQGLSQWTTGANLGLAVLLVVAVVVSLRRGGAARVNIVDWVVWVAAPAAGVVAGMLVWRASDGSIVVALGVGGYAALGAWFMVWIYSRQQKTLLEASLGEATPTCPTAGPEMSRSVLLLVALFAAIAMGGLGLAAAQISTSSCPRAVDYEAYFDVDRADFDGYQRACSDARDDESRRAWRFSSLAALGLAGAAVTLKRGGAGVSNLGRWHPWVGVPVSATYLAFQLWRSFDQGFAHIAVPVFSALFGLFALIAFPRTRKGSKVPG